MALQVDREIHNITVPNCYVVISNIYAIKDRDVTVTVEIYKNKADSDNKIGMIDGTSFHLDWVEDFSRTAMYTHIKTLPGFENALDV